MNTVLLLIDLQIDFCSPEGALFVPGSPEDCMRITRLIDALGTKITSLCITLDCHQSYHIAHPVFWKNSEGKNPNPFTIIRHADVLGGLWQPVNPNLTKKTEQYVSALEAAGKFNHTIWPPHCLLGSEGFALEKNVYGAVKRWEIANGHKNSDFFCKSPSMMTEHYSAVQAEVPDPDDPSTRINFALMDKLKTADEIYIAGEALSHCVANTVQDLLAWLPAKKMTILTDCTSSISGYEESSRKLLREFSGKGIKMRESTGLIH